MRLLFNLKKEGGGAIHNAAPKKGKPMENGLTTRFIIGGVARKLKRGVMAGPGGYSFLPASFTAAAAVRATHRMMARITKNVASSPQMVKMMVIKLTNFCACSAFGKIKLPNNDSEKGATTNRAILYIFHTVFFNFTLSIILLSARKRVLSRRK
jgi:hypothetical protein